MKGYDLSRAWFDYCFENPEKTRPVYTALYFFAMEQCNRLGWKKKFGLPTTMAMEAIGVKSYNTYIKAFRFLVDEGFFEIIEWSKNQYSSNIIALSKNNKATNKALDKALLKHTTKQSESTEQSTVSINKPLTINNKPITINSEFSFLVNDILKYFEFNETRNPDKARLTLMALRTLDTDGKLPYFKQQYEAYKKYRPMGDKFQGTLKNYLGSKQTNYTDGNWNAKDYTRLTTSTKEITINDF